MAKDRKREIVVLGKPCAQMRCLRHQRVGKVLPKVNVHPRVTEGGKEEEKEEEREDDDDN